MFDKILSELMLKERINQTHYGELLLGRFHLPVCTVSLERHLVSRINCFAFVLTYTLIDSRGVEREGGQFNVPVDAILDGVKYYELISAGIDELVANLPKEYVYA